MDVRSLSDDALRRAHSMFAENPQAFADAPEYMHAIVAEYARRFSQGNVEADLEAASTPIATEPVAGPAFARGTADRTIDSAIAGTAYSPSEAVDAMRVGDRPSLTSTMRSANTLASSDAFDAAFRSNGSHYPSATAAFAEDLVSRGVAPEYAQRAAAARAAEHRALAPEGVYEEEMQATEDPNELYPGYQTPAAPRGRVGNTGSPLPDADPRTTRAQRLDALPQWEAEVDRKKEAYDRATGLQPPAAPAPTGPYAGAGRPGYDRTYTPDEVLAQRESSGSGGAPLGFTVPGPRLPTGEAVRPGVPIYDEKEAAAYNTRPVDPKTGQLLPSPRDLAMRERGMVPIYHPDGSVGYSVEAYPEDDPSTPGREGLPFPGEVGRRGRRQDLLDKGWEAREVDGPTGRQTVYRPGPTAQAEYDAQADARSRSRIQRSAGISSSEAEGLTTEELRARARAKRDDDYNARNATWRAQAMLAGGQPTGGLRGSKATLAAWNALGQDGLNDWQRLTMAKALRPDIDGTSPLTVEANSARNALRLINADMVGQGGLGDTRRQMMLQQQREQADEMAQQEARKLLGWTRGALTPQEAERIRRRVEARFPGMGSVVDGLPIEDGVGTAARPSSGPPAPPPAPGPMNGLPRFGS